jgi:hypothetical protein
VADQVLRPLRFGPLFEIGRRADDSHARVWPDPHRDHVLADLFAAADAGIVALSDDIRQPVIHGDLDFDVGIVAQQLFKLRQQDRVCRIFGCRDANATGRLVAKLAERRKLGLNLLKARAEALHEPLARLRRRDPACCAGEQPDAKPRLELAHGMA